MRLFRDENSAKMKVFLLLLIASASVVAFEQNVLMTEVFEIVIDPTIFKWSYEGVPDQFVYQASLQNAPDLPSWMNYIYSNKHHSGFLYGVPPNKNNANISIEIVALNKKTYETRQETLTIHVNEKLNPAKYEVQMKIDNLNVEDMFDDERLDLLKDVFRKQLWKDSQSDLYITFLASAIQLGARKPLNPNEGEGVVIRLGSKASFSTELIELQEEVRPLWKVPSCPRDFKRTTVERYFRENGFALDWCSFRLISHENNSALQQSVRNFQHKSSNGWEIISDEWKSVHKRDVPKRTYTNEIVFTILLPMFILLVLAILLSFILCFHHEGIKDEASEEYFDNIFHICIDYFSSRRMKEITEDEITQYATIHKATESLRGLSNNRNLQPLSPDSAVISRAHTESPTSTLVRGVHCRPSPPPYVRPKFKPEL